MFYSPDIYSKALKFTSRAYQNQDLSDFGFLNFTHAVAVCGEVIAALNEHPEIDGDLAVQCALLHDILRRTGIRHDHLMKNFGVQVAKAVYGITPDEGLPQEEPNLRLMDSLRRIRIQTKEIWMVEMANWIVKLDMPPNRATKFRLNRICHEATAVYAALKEACPHHLADRLIRRIEAYADR